MPTHLGGDDHARRRALLQDLRHAAPATRKQVSHAAGLRLACVRPVLAPGAQPLVLELRLLVLLRAHARSARAGGGGKRSQGCGSHLAGRPVGARARAAAARATFVVVAAAAAVVAASSVAARSSFATRLVVVIIVAVFLGGRLGLVLRANGRRLEGMPPLQCQTQTAKPGRRCRPCWVYGANTFTTKKSTPRQVARPVSRGAYSLYTPIVGAVIAAPAVYIWPRRSPVHVPSADPLVGHPSGTMALLQGKQLQQLYPKTKQNKVGFSPRAWRAWRAFREGCWLSLDR